MKKIFALFLIVIATLTITTYACAEWSVTVTWTKSVGPNLAYEEAFYNSVSKCTITPPAATTCNFVIPDLIGDIWIRSFNYQGAFADTSHVTLQVLPAPATGVIVNVTFIP